MTFEELKAEALRQGYKLEKIPKIIIRRKAAFPNHGKAWTTTDMQLAETYIKAGKTIYELSEFFKRTPLSIMDVLNRRKVVLFDSNTHRYTMPGGKLVATRHELRAYAEEKIG